MTKPTLLTFGCRLNSFESEIMKQHAETAGLDDVILVNTCAVTGEAVRQARQSIRRAKRDNPSARVVVTGCAAQIDPAQFAEMDEVDAVIGNQDKLEATAYQSLAKDMNGVHVTDIMTVKETAGHLIDGLTGRARAFVQIQNGCDHRCTFCIIPYGRGNSRSVPAGQVVEQIKRLVDKGYNEVVLTGVDITSWGSDQPGAPSLGRLVNVILEQVPDLPRLRLTSIDSIEVDPQLLDAITNHPRLMPHIHLSLQAGDNMILKRMKRRHLRDDAIRFCKDLKKARPDVVFGADIITGFPTETEEMFQNSLKLVEECDLTFLHVFPYSARKGTPAAKMPQVKKDIRKERAKRLRDLGEQQVQKLFQSLQGKRDCVLIERVMDGAAL
ncbi:MAG: tRNA (N(6)-L-threonylcarbamoyladenosine(37)-C(2))-methylthiotransferase MtaB, partial [Sphingomonadales bacterium]|nr:tRNA (N(6)-L-threonylcarbamoyladenosine(37)-C(2))-methylthiotransferase MtaB [Sphingomonadales bacterium]